MAALMPQWLAAWFQPPDIALSRKLVSELHLPDSTAQFVLALRPRDAPDSVVYLLSSLCFSEKAVADVRELIAAAHPKAVVALVDLEAIESFREEERLAETDASFGVPSSILGVVQEHIERDPNVVPYSSRARIEVGRSIFGAGAYGDTLEAKKCAAKVNANFRYIDFPYRASGHLDDPQESESPPENYVATRRATQGFRAFATKTPLDELRQWRESSSAALAQMIDQSRSLSVEDRVNVYTVPDRRLSTEESAIVTFTLCFLKLKWPLCIDRSGDAETSLENAESSSESGEDSIPEFGLPFLDLFEALYRLYQTPVLGQAYQHALRVFQSVEKGEGVNPSDLTEACRYRVYLEMSRMLMNNAISASARKVPTRRAAEFENLSYEEKCHALLAQSLQKDAREHGTVVAVVDVNRISGIRQQWNQQIPEDHMPLIDECYISTDEVEEVSFLETLFRSTQAEEHHDASQEKKAAVVVGAGAAAAVGLAYLPNWAAPLTPIIKFVSAKGTTLLKIGFLNSKRALALTVAKGIPGASNLVLPVKASAAKSASASVIKAAITAEKAQAAAQGLVSGLQRQTFQAIRTSFYSAMRGTQKKQFRRSAWALFGGSVVAASGMLLYGDEVERTLGSIAYAPTVAKLGRGLESLSEASHMVGVNWDVVYNEVYNLEQNFLTRLKRRFG